MLWLSPGVAIPRTFLGLPGGDMLDGQHDPQADQLVHEAAIELLVDELESLDLLLDCTPQDARLIALELRSAHEFADRSEPLGVASHHAECADHGGKGVQ